MGIAFENSFCTSCKWTKIYRSGAKVGNRQEWKNIDKYYHEILWQFTKKAEKKEIVLTNFLIRDMLNASIEKMSG